MAGPDATSDCETVKPGYFGSDKHIGMALVGLEPTRFWATDFESVASANSATRPSKKRYCSPAGDSSRSLKLLTTSPFADLITTTICSDPSSSRALPWPFRALGLHALDRRDRCSPSKEPTLRSNVAGFLVLVIEPSFARNRTLRRFLCHDDPSRMTRTV